MLSQNTFTWIRNNNSYDSLFPDFITTEAPRWENIKSSENDCLNAKLIVTEDKVRGATDFSHFKSSGIDGVYQLILQSGCTPYSPRRYTQSFLSHEIYKNGMERCENYILPESEKREHCTPKAYQPFSFTSFFLKILEWPTVRYKRNEVLRNKPLHPNQHNYTTGRSCN